MIIGNGLIAQVFKNQPELNNVVIIAAGVSNSTTARYSDYLREKELIKSLLDSQRGSSFVYFGSTGVYNEAQRESDYIQHKLEMENLISTQSEKHLILRLPNVIGPKFNTNTTINFLFDRVTNGVEFVAHINQLRFLIDVEWIPLIVQELLKSQTKGLVENFVINEGATVKSIISIVEEISEKKAIYKVDETSSAFDIPVSKQLLKISFRCELPVNEKYEYELIRRYFYLFNSALNTSPRIF